MVAATAEEVHGTGLGALGPWGDWTRALTYVLRNRGYQQSEEPPPHHHPPRHTDLHLDFRHSELTVDTPTTNITTTTQKSMASVVDVDTSSGSGACGSSSSGGDDSANRIDLHVPSNLLIVPTAAAVVGFALGMRREGGKARLRFLAENAHRQPTTVQGWVSAAPASAESRERAARRAVARYPSLDHSLTPAVLLHQDTKLPRLLRRPARRLEIRPRARHRRGPVRRRRRRGRVSA